MTFAEAIPLIKSGHRFFCSYPNDKNDDSYVFFLNTTCKYGDISYYPFLCIEFFRNGKKYHMPYRLTDYEVFSADWQLINDETLFTADC
jgi:hypothetical protein